jgi:hypothetical protein
MRKGFAGYVLMSFDNYVYLTVEDGDLFGHVDLVLHKRALEQKLNGRIKDGAESEADKSDKLQLQRVFSVQSLVNSELVMLPINYLLQMKREFYSEWKEMMTNAY